MNNEIIEQNIQIICREFNLVNDRKIKELYNNLWFPLALNLQEKFKEKSKPLLVGILGIQGTGKTTLSKILKFLLKQLNISSETISLDDFYKTYEERKQLQKFDPRLIWRGPPLTHDVSLAMGVLTSLLESRPVAIPRFDKSLHNGKGDRTLSSYNGNMALPNTTLLNNQISHNIDVIFFEGWFVGVQPIDENEFNNPPHPIISPADKKFARDCNQRLKEYLPLWKLIDYQIILNPLDYRYSLPWRQEAEAKMKAQGKTGMSNQEIQEFVEYFWKALHPELFIPKLIDNLSLTDSLVITIDKEHFCQDYMIRNTKQL
ncbi:glycerate kinase [Cyanobacterium stanieri LEGE 03274]|uniref:Glycerate kinase n=1 Tax=Cyanobacterium stanieri LEGE 03274 TaxID=1828756 RepID=A0ABR9V0V4_9CHRO|nr:glycerate kinase [Cyanobacterium stanieri]MBE9221513.1 glycerate kinase [Cyanobacterium stanieri LEGE 03274]